MERKRKRQFHLIHEEWYPEKFFSSYGMSVQKFDELLTIVKPILNRKN